MAENYNSREERRKQQSAGTKKKTPKKKKGGILKKIFLVLIALGLAGIIIGAGAFAYMVKDTPKLDEEKLKSAIASEIYDMNGEQIATIGSENRDYVEYEDIPKIVEEAVIATEDSRFYKHHGIDPIRLGGAVLANITEGFGAEGASTITQQVAKNYFLEFDKKLSRKAQEAWLAIQLERKYTKHEILELYMNKVNMSQYSYGFATASETYFGKPLKDLELHEAALLAGLPQSPNNYNPFNHPDKAEKRRNIVLTLMNKHGYITKEQMEAAKKVPVTSSLVAEENRKINGDIPYDSFIGQAIAEINDKYGTINVFTDGLKIHTTLDKNAQEYVETMLNGNEIVEFPNEEFQAGITLLDTKTGEIRALGGNRNPEVEFGFNYATDQKRQPGSTIKPVLDYGPAIEYLKWGTYYTLDDKPYTYSDGTEFNNWDGRHMGPMSMREALARSRNVPAVMALQEVGLDRAKDFAVDLGIPLDEIFESYAIGGLGKGVSSMQMAGAYSAFGNNGIYNTPHTVKSVELRDGTKLDLAPESKVVMKDYTAFMITDMLKSVVKDSYGTGQQANVQGLPVAGKTGTTNYSNEEISKYNVPDGAVPDAWFAGYTTNYTAAVWTGYKDRKNYLPSNGRDQKIAQNLFKNLIAHVSEGKDTPDFKMPKSVEVVKIEKGTSKLASAYTPSDQILTEYAVKGEAPTQVSKKYDKLDAPQGLSAVYDPETNEIVVGWEYGSEEGVQFEVNASVDGSGQQPTVTSEKGLRFTAPSPGSTYTFSITAFRNDMRSDPASVSVTIPGAPEDDGEEEPEDGEDGSQDDDANQNDEENEENNQNPGNGNGNGGNEEDDGEDDGSGSEGETGSGGESGSGGDSGQTGQNGGQTGSGGGTGSGSGSGGSGTGTGSGGSGTGSGTGSGSGSGSGTGSGSGSGSDGSN
ncbi:penicillin-binding protein 1A [Bacillus infantis]|uniref:penicillin-binding protein 1A n=1 Tax=Bacillus infantis TaxID=324767 RepID=UPI0021559E44|nr:penicillin-binding protein 1A [Bacillus infantis]MCR6611740.1 PBP1A family penicillin-binding protein [Bacillus infantis]